MATIGIVIAGCAVFGVIIFLAGVGVYEWREFREYRKREICQVDHMTPCPLCGRLTCCGAFLPGWWKQINKMEKEAIEMREQIMALQGESR